MPPREVLVTYTLYPSGHSDLQAAVAGIKAQLPLRNLHWKPQSRTSIRTIQEVEVKLLELGDVPPAKDQVAGSLLESPLVNLCLVACDDAELYKNNVKNFVRDWLSLLASRRNVHAPLIILVNPASAAAQSSKNVFGRDKGIIAKLRADFNTTKRDRCAQLTLSPNGLEDPTVWPEAINKLKESIISAFGVAVFEREEEVKRGEAQRVTVGWNFCVWFLLKSFEAVNLFEDALIVYEELEASFFQVLKEQNLSWFGKLGATGKQDDSLPILDTTAKPYRVLLQSSTISVFDFRIYVFARQCFLLGKLGRVTEIAKRGQWFIASLTRRLRENEYELAEHFLESWTYTACMDLVQHCDEWSRLERPNGDYSGLIAYESARAELLDIARVQVERIGVAAKHLPNEYPFKPTTALVAAGDDVLFESSDAGSDAPQGEHGEAPARPKLSNRVLLEALEDSAAFHSLYTSLTKKAVAAYEACGKQNSAIRLRADLAGLALYTEDWKLAFDLCRALARSCAELFIWDPVAKFALEGALRAHGQLGAEKDDEWINLALAYVRACAVTKGDDDQRILVDVLASLREIDDVREGQLTTELYRLGTPLTTVDAKPAFSVRVMNGECAFSTVPGITQIDVEISSTLPTPVRVDSLNLEFVDRYDDKLSYTCGELLLNPGVNTVEALSSTAAAGLYALNKASIMLGAVSFSTEYGATEVALVVRRNPNGLKAVMRVPNEKSTIVLDVHSGSQSSQAVRIQITALMSEIQLDTARATLNGKELGGAGWEIDELSAGEIASIHIPYSGQTHDDQLEVRIDVHYDSKTGGRSFRDVQQVCTGLPLTVNVQDFFRPDCLISGFTIAADRQEHLRIGSVELRADGGYEVESARKRDQQIIVTPYQPLSCLYKIKATSGRPAKEVLRLAIRYRTIEEGEWDEIGIGQVQLLVQAAMDGLEAPRPDLQRAVRQRLAQDSWLSMYIADSNLATLFQNEIGDSEFLQALEQTKVEDLHWRLLEIPVDVPARRLLTTVHLARPGTDAIAEGRALPIDVSLHSTAIWASGEDVQGVRVAFEIQANPDDWLIVGMRKGIYTVDLAMPEQRRIVVVPMRAGRLALPTVTVSLATPPPTGSGRELVERLLCETYVDNAAEIVHVLPASVPQTTLVPVRPMGWIEAEA